ncbi:pyridoxamine 5'-phosphate oxidase family protein [Cryomorphaceae bacterium 1068]|nr:pyridoxamine 5'-phosphate oxidase family protein [Cryomorphaceae bacterium 1068]
MGKVIEAHHDLETVRRLCIGQLARGVQKKNHPFREVAMATVDGVPNIRMVILRKLKQDPLSILVYTDNRSGKIAELKANPHASFLFWHPTSKFQLKLKTKVVIHQNDKMAAQHYHSIGERGRESYNTVKAPGSAINAEKNPYSELKEKFDDSEFCVLECNVMEMEALQLSREGHIRAHFNIKDNESNFIVP